MPSNHQTQDLNLGRLRIKPDSNWHVRQSLWTHSLELTNWAETGTKRWILDEDRALSNGRWEGAGICWRCPGGVPSPRPHTPSSVILPTTLPGRHQHTPFTGGEAGLGKGCRSPRPLANRNVSSLGLRSVCPGTWAFPTLPIKLLPFVSLFLLLLIWKGRWKSPPIIKP